MVQQAERQVLHADEHYTIRKLESHKIEIEGTASYSTAETMAYWMARYGKEDCDGDRCSKTACHQSAACEMLWCDELAEVILSVNSKFTDEEVAKRFHLPVALIHDERLSYRQCH